MNLRTGELSRLGKKLELQEKPFQTLAALLERPGELVTREELRERLWGTETFVDFDQGLNKAVNRLRETLGDSAERPRFVETLPKKGYRFIAAVQRSEPRDVGWMKWLIAGVAAILAAAILVSWRPVPTVPTVAGIVRITNDGRPKDRLRLLLSDGPRLYLQEGLRWTESHGIAQVSISAGVPAWVDTPLRDVQTVEDISTRGELLLRKAANSEVDTLSELWVQPVPAGPPYRVGNLRADAASWSPDGNHIAYAIGRRIFVAKRDGSDTRELATLPGDARSLRFSPDGTRLRFTRFDEETVASIWEIQPDGKDLHPLFPNWKEASFHCCGNWSRDGRFYYFQAVRGTAADIWVLAEPQALPRPAGAPSRLTAGPLRFGAPVASSDGKTLYVIGEEPRVELLRYVGKRYEPYLSGSSAGPVDFSHDRRWITYVSYPDLTLWRSKPDGSERIQLTFPPMRVYQPRWSPDDSQIAFLDTEYGKRWKVFLISPSGGIPQPLWADNLTDADATWSPDGKWIVVGSVDTSGELSIARVDLATRTAKPVAGSKDLYSPRLSPDGRYIAAFTSASSTLMLFDFNSERWSQLAQGGSFGYNEWSHDGKYLYVRRFADAGADLIRIRVQDGRMEHVLSLKDFQQPMDIFAFWIGLTPDDAPLLMRDRSIEEIYALDLVLR